MAHIRSKIGFFILGIVFIVVLGLITILIWNPLGKVEADRAWFNQRTQGAADTVNEYLTKINEAEIKNNEVFSQLMDESNANNPDKKRMKQLANSITDDLVKMKILADEGCFKFRGFIESDLKDKEQRRQDIDKVCQIFNVYKEAIDFRQNAVYAILDDMDRVYELNMKLSNEKFNQASKMTMEFKPMPLYIPQ